MDSFKTSLLENWGQKHLGDFFGSWIIWSRSSKYKVELKRLIGDHSKKADITCPSTCIYSYIFTISTLYLSIKLKKLVKFTDFFLLECRNQYGSYFLFRPGLGYTGPGIPTIWTVCKSSIFFFSVFFIEINILKKGLREIIHVPYSSNFYSMVDGTYHFFSAVRIS